MSIYYLQEAHRKKTENKQVKEKKPCERKKNENESRLIDFRKKKKFFFSF
jgi:hypothetical protein